MKKLHLTVLACLIIGNCFSQLAPINNVTDKSTQSVFPVISKPALVLFPNPAKNKVSLNVKGFERGMAAVKVMDMKGTPVREDNRLLVSGEEEVIMFFMLPPGIYFVTIRQKDKIARKKLVIN